MPTPWSAEILFLLALALCLATSSDRPQTPQSNHNLSIERRQQGRWINENLIIHFVKTFKHINLATLLVCPSSLVTVSLAADDQHVDDGVGATENTTRTKQQSSTKLLINISKHLMAASILIKASDIDLMTKKVGQQQEGITSRSTSSSPLERDPNQKLETNNSATPSVNIDARNSSSYRTLLTLPLALSNMLKSGDFKQAIVLQLSCRRSKFILQQTSMDGLFNASYHWLLLDDFPSIFEVDFFESLNINMNSEITLAKPQSVEREKYDLYDVWNPGRQYGGMLNVSYLGQYPTVMSDNQSPPQTTIARRMNVSRISIRCMIVVTSNILEPFEQYLEHTYNPHLDSMNRFNFALLSYVRDLFNFTLRMYRTNSWGYLKNGTFDGMVGALVRKEVDIGGSPIFFRLERAKVIDYTARTWIARPCFLFRHPTERIRNIFLQPFTNHVWWCILICGILTILTIAKITHEEQRLLVPPTSPVHPDAAPAPASATNKSIKRWCNRTIPTSTMSDEKAYKLQPHRLRMQRRRRVAWKTTISTQTPPQPSGNRIAITSLSPTVGLINTFSAAPSLTIRRTQAARPQSHSKSWRHYDADGGSVVGLAAGATTRKSRKNHRYDDTIITSDIHQRHRCVNDRAVKRSQMNQTKISPSKFKMNIFNRNCFHLSEYNFSRSTIQFLGALCQQGSSELPLLPAGRYIVWLILLFTFAVYQFYSASIVGSLLMVKPKSIKTVRDLIDSSLDLGIEDIIYNRDFFNRTTDTDAIELFEKRVRHVDKMSGNVTTNWLKPIDGLKKTKAGGYAFHVDVATAYKIIIDTFSEREVCELTEIQLYPPQHMVSIVQKGSPLRKMITYGLRRVTEVGLLYRQRMLWHTQRPKCVRQIHPSDFQVGMQSTSSAHFILLVGFMLSIVVLMLEIGYSKWKHQSCRYR